MKHIEIRKGKKIITIETPWLRIDEAAAYLGVARSTFDQIRGAIPTFLIGNVEVYDSRILDRIANLDPAEDRHEEALADEAFAHRRPIRGDRVGEPTLTHPGTGRIFTPSASRSRKANGAGGKG